MDVRRITYNRNRYATIRLPVKMINDVMGTPRYVEVAEKDGNIIIKKHQI